MEIKDIRDIVIMDRLDYERYIELKKDLLDENLELKKKIYKVKTYLLNYESYIPEDDIPEIVRMLDGE